MDSTTRRLSSTPEPSATQPAPSDAQPVSTGLLNGLPVSPASPGLAQSSALSGQVQVAQPSEPLSGKHVSVVKPSLPDASESKAKPARSAPQEPLESKSAKGGQDPRVIQAMTAALTRRVPEQPRAALNLAPLSQNEELPIDPSDEDALYIAYNPSFGPIATLDKSARGAFLLSAAVLSGPEDRIRACFQMADKVVAEHRDAPLDALSELLGQLDEAQSTTQAPRLVATEKAQRGIKLAKTALYCRIGKHLGIHSARAAHDKARELMGAEAPPAWFGKRLRSVSEEGFRHSMGDYKMVFKLDRQDAATRVEKLLAVAMNRHDNNPRAAWSEVIEQIQRFDENGPEFKTSLMEEVVAALKMAGEAPSSGMK